MMVFKKGNKSKHLFFNLIIMMVIGLAIITCLELISAGNIYKQNDVIDLKIQCIINGTYCSNSAVCNITIFYPNNSLLLNNEKMTNQLSFYNYTLPDSSVLDDYKCSATCCDSGLCGTDPCDFLITGNGKEKPSGAVIVLFSIIFLIILGFMVYSMIHLIAHVFTLDYDMLDMAFSIGIYFAILGLNILQEYYLGNPDFKSWIGLIIQIGLWTHLLLPIFSFAFILTAGQWIKQKIITRENQ